MARSFSKGVAVDSWGSKCGFPALTDKSCICNSSSGKVGIGNFLQLAGLLILSFPQKKMNWRTTKEDIILYPPLISMHLQLILTYAWASHVHTKSHAYTSAKYTYKIKIEEIIHYWWMWKDLICWSKVKATWNLLWNCDYRASEKAQQVKCVPCKPTAVVKPQHPWKGETDTIKLSPDFYTCTMAHVRPLLQYTQ